MMPSSVLPRIGAWIGPAGWLRAGPWPARWRAVRRGDGMGWSVGADFGDRDAGGLLVDDGAVAHERGGEGVDREVVHRPRVSARRVVDQGDRVVAEQRVGPP